MERSYHSHSGKLEGPSEQGSQVQQQAKRERSPTCISHNERASLISFTFKFQGRLIFLTTLLSFPSHMVL